MRVRGALGYWGLFLCCAGFFLFFPARADAAIARFIFTTEPQAIPAAELSGACTIQAQNIGGEAQQSEETIDLSFSSTSATGEFLSAIGEPVRTVMNKGTANRTFYYRDASLGTHTLTVTAVGRISRQSWVVSQEISVGSAASAPAPAAGAPAPAGSVSVSAVPPTPAIEARAGSDRTAVTGAPVDFTGTAIGLLKEPIDNARFWWNFGDGSAADGKDVSHIFRAPGTYTAGLHVSSGVYAASDYTTVTVISNKVAILEVAGGEQGFIRMRNGSEATVDIGGWMIAAGDGRKFVLPPHTLIRGKSDVALTHTVTGLSDAGPLSVHFPDGTLSFVYTDEPVAPAQDTTPAPLVAAVAASSGSTAGAFQKTNTDTPIIPSGAYGIVSSSPSVASLRMSASSSGSSFLLLAALLSAGASAGFLFLKKFLS